MVGIGVSQRVGLVLLAGGLSSACIPNAAAPAQTYAGPPVTTREQAYERRTLDQDVRALPAPPPAWEARKVTADARLVSSSTYVVQPGDSLRAIAARTGAGSEAIARANGIAPPS